MQYFLLSKNYVLVAHFDKAYKISWQKQLLFLSNIKVYINLNRDSTHHAIRLSLNFDKLLFLLTFSFFPFSLNIYLCYIDIILILQTNQANLRRTISQLIKYFEIEEQDRKCFVNFLTIFSTQQSNNIYVYVIQKNNSFPSFITHRANNF